MPGETSRDRSASGVSLPWSQLRRVSARLTERDREILALLADLRVLTTDQVARLGFTSAITARHRLQELVGLRVLDVFRPRAERGSYPNHYILAPLGAAVVASQDPDLPEHQVKRIQRRVRLDQQLALGRERILAHQKGVNDFYIGLRQRAARVPGAELVAWMGERGLGDAYGDGFEERIRGEARRPDGYGQWREDGRETRFLLEYDRGTENLERLAAKLEGYHDFFQDAAGADFLRANGEVWLLFAFLSARRERNARHALRASAHARDLHLATGVVEIGDDPGEAHWLPLDAEGGLRSRLADLPALPAPRPLVPPSRSAQPWRGGDPDDDPTRWAEQRDRERIESAGARWPRRDSQLGGLGQLEEVDHDDDTW